MKAWVVAQNWGLIIGWFGVVQCIACSVGFAFARDWRRALYYLFACAITLTVIWPTKG